MKREAKLVSIENDRPLTKNTHAEFWYTYQNSVLLALKQAGILTEMQYRRTEEKLSEQRKSLLRTQIQKKEETKRDPCRKLLPGVHRQE